MSNLLNFVDYDFDNLVDQLVERLQANSLAWKDTYRSATGQMIIDLFAYIANMNQYYIERRAEETYLETAQLRSSVIELVKLLNYNPKRSVSATGNLTISVPLALAKKVFIPKYTECQTAEGVKFLVSVDAVLLTGQTSIAVAAVQGEQVDINVIADGTANFEYSIEDIAVENTYLEVYIDGVLWTKVTSFLLSDVTATNYTVTLESDDFVTIRFGDGINGAVPVVGVTILIRYIRTLGVSGNIYSAGSVTTINDSIYDEDGDEITDISVTNTDSFLGGDSAESTAEIAYEAPRVFATGDRAITRDDYIAILENYAGVATANAWGENEETAPNYDMFNCVKLVVILQEWELPGDTLKTTLSEYLYTKSMMTVKYEFVVPEIVEIIPVLDVKVNAGNTLSQIQSNIEVAFEDEFELGITTDLGQSKYLSDLIRVIDTLAGVAYHSMELEIYQEMTAGYTSFFDYGETLYITDVLAGSVRVFFNDTQIAVDDGSGLFTDIVSGYTVNNVGAAGIDYESGLIGLNPLPAPGVGDTLYVRYQQNESGNVIVTKNQICKLREVDITAIAYTS